MADSATNPRAKATLVGVPAYWRWTAARPWGVFVLTAVLYAAGSGVALLLLRQSGLSGVFFIPAGITVAFLLRTERRHWWLVILGAMVAEAAMDLRWGFDSAETAFYVAGNAIEPLIGAAIVSTKVRSLDLARLQDLAWFFIGAVVIGPGVGAAIGSLGPTVLSGGNFAQIFPQWWLGDAVGVVVIGGLILVWGSSPDRLPLASRWGAVLLGGTVALTAGVLARSDLEFMFAVLIVVVIAGAVFGPRAVAVTAGLVSATVAFDMVVNHLTLAEALRPQEAMTLLKMKIGTFTLAGLLVAAQQTERGLAERRSHQDRSVSLRLQEALLPRLDVDYAGVEVAARYEAATDHLLAGGDWYDVYPLPGGRVGITVGDVIGHGLEATASMGRLRAAVAALAPHARDPGELLSFLHSVASGPEGTPYATAICATLDPANGRFEYASAGHPPMLIVSPGVGPAWVTGGLSAPLAGPLEGDRTHETMRLPAGAMLVLYSDGLVEKRGETIQSGLDRLIECLEAVEDADAATICEVIFVEMGVAEHLHDDVVVLVVKWVGPQP